MDNKEIKFEDIVGQAPTWTFAGDNLLLEWMKQISQGLESRANQTTSNLMQLDKSIKETDIALNNMANSLNALQYGNQFVESRVKDDDDVLNNDVRPKRSANATKISLSAETVLEKFLDNNIKMLRNCYERYSIDLDDDDTDDDTDDMTDNDYGDNVSREKKTFIYQPNNPYNERPLPHIINTKEWHQKWHAGLPDDKQNEMNEYSEDDEKSNDSMYSENDDDNNSYESNRTSNISQWASSSNSLQNDTFQKNYQVKNASLLKEQQQIQQTLHLPSNNMKSNTTITTTTTNGISNFIKESSDENNVAVAATAAATTKPIPPKTLESLSNGLPNSIKSALKIDTTTSDRSIKHQSKVDVNYSDDDSSKVSSSIGGAAAATATATTYVDLFSEVSPVNVQSQQQHQQQQIHQPQHQQHSQIKRKTINLFDDDDFQSFMSEVQQKTVQQLQTNAQNMKEENQLKSPTLPLRTPTTATLSPPSTPPLKTLRTKPSLIAKLFDDDDDAEDEDFFNIFANKSTKLPAVTSKRKKPLFDDKEDNDNDIFSADNTVLNNFSTNTRNLFDDQNDEQFERKSYVEIPRKDNDEVIVKKVIPIGDIYRKSQSVENEVAATPATPAIMKKPEQTVYNDYKGKEEEKGEDENLLFSNSTKNISNVNNSMTSSIWNVPINVKDTAPGENLSAPLIKSNTNLQVVTKSIDKVEENMKPRNTCYDVRVNVEKNELNQPIPEQSKSHINLISSKAEDTIEETIKCNENHNVASLEGYSDDAKNVNNGSQNNNNSISFSSSNEEGHQDTKHFNYEQNLNNIISSKSTTSTTPATSTVTVVTTHNASTTAKQPQTLTNNYQLNVSLFLDEPPDDNEFFDKLFTTSSPSPAPLSVSPLDIQSQNQKQQQQQLLTSLLAEGQIGEGIERGNFLQHSFYETELPKLPEIKTTTNNNNEQQLQQQQQQQQQKKKKKKEKEKKEQKKNPELLDTSNIYKNLQLFNEVPPDDDNDDDDDDDDHDDYNYDDNEDEDEVNANNNGDTLKHYDDGIRKLNNSYNTLPNIFYDDFNETLKALNEQKQFINDKEEEIVVETVKKQNHPNVMVNDDKSYTTIENQSSRNDDVKTPSILDENSCHNILKMNKDKEKGDNEVEIINDDKIKEDSVQIENSNAKGTTVSTIRDTFNNCQVMASNPSMILATDKVNKLKMPNIQINVKALLPQASQSEGKTFDIQQQQPKQLSQHYQQQQLQQQQQKFVKITTDNNNHCNIIDSGLESHKDDESETMSITVNRNYLLPNVNKDRIKIPVKRRASTRKGRQENCKNFPLKIPNDNDNNDTNNNHNYDSNQIEENLLRPTNTTTSTSIIFDTENVINSNVLTTNRMIENVIGSENIKELTNSSIQQMPPHRNEFESEMKDELINDFMKTEVATKSHLNKIFDDEDDDWNDLFVTNIKKMKQDEHSQIQKHSIINMNTNNHNNNSFHPEEKQIVGEERKENETADIHEGKAVKSVAVTLSASTATIMKKQFATSTALFDSSDNDDDDLFGSLAVKKLTTTKTSPASSSSLSSSVIATQKNFIKKLNENHSNKTASSLFSDSDSDNDDDLFTKTRKATKVTKQEQQQKQPLSSRTNLFGDDEMDSDDADLFSGINKKSATITSTAVAAKAITATTIASQSTKQDVTIAESHTATNIGDNPLADLL